MDQNSLLAQLQSFFQRQNVTAFLVGGCVRDGLLGRASADLDLAVMGDALLLARQLAASLGGSYVPLDPLRSTARVVLKSDLLPTVAGPTIIDLSAVFGGLEADLAGRDFTIDAMATPLQDFRGEWDQAPILDPTGGRRDLALRLLRSTREDGFLEDPLRLLRGVRLAAELDFTIEPVTQAMIHRHYSLITLAAPERVREELCRILATERAGYSLWTLDHVGLLDILFPPLAQTKGVTQPKEHYWDVFQHCLATATAVECLLSRAEPAEVADELGMEWAGVAWDQVLAAVPWSPALESYFREGVGSQPRSSLLKLAALLHDIAKPQTKTLEPDGRTRFFGHAQQGAEATASLLERFRFSRRETQVVRLMVEHHLRPMQLTAQGQLPTGRAIYRYFRDTGEMGIATLFLSLADHLAARGPLLSMKGWIEHAKVTQYVIVEYLAQKERGAPPKLLTGHDIMERFGLEPGPLVGQLLEGVLEAQAAGRATTRDEAIAVVQRALPDRSPVDLPL